MQPRITEGADLGSTFQSYQSVRGLTGQPSGVVSAVSGRSAISSRAVPAVLAATEAAAPMFAARTLPRPADYEPSLAEVNVGPFQRITSPWRSPNANASAQARSRLAASRSRCASSIEYGSISRVGIRGALAGPPTLRPSDLGGPPRLTPYGSSGVLGAQSLVRCLSGSSSRKAVPNARAPAAARQQRPKDAESRLPSRRHGLCQVPDIAPPRLRKPPRYLMFL